MRADNAISILIFVGCFLAMVIWILDAQNRAIQTKAFAGAPPDQKLMMIYQKQQELEARVNVLQGLVMCK